MKKHIWKATLGEDIPAIVLFGLVIYTWPKITICTVDKAVQKMGSISPIRRKS